MVASVQKHVDALKSGESEIFFTLEKWGVHSDTIKGDLAELCLKVREIEELQALQVGEHREPHVALRK